METVPETFTVDTANPTRPEARVVLEVPARALDVHPVADEIANLRANLPFVPVLPYPKAASLVSLAQNTSGDLQIPDNAVLMKVTGQAPFLMSNQGAADGKTSALAGTQGNPATATDVLVGLETEWLYCYGMRTLSVRNPNATAQLIGARFIYRDEII